MSSDLDFWLVKLSTIFPQTNIIMSHFESHNPNVHLLDGGSYQFTLESENHLVFLSQLLQQSLLFVGILQDEQKEAELHIFWDKMDSSDLSVGPYSRRSNMEPKTNTDTGVCGSCCLNKCLCVFASALCVSIYESFLLFLLVFVVNNDVIMGAGL